MGNKKVLYIKCLMLLMEIIVILFINILIYVTTEKICSNYIARDFIETVEAIPSRPSSIMLVSVMMIGLLVISFIIRELIYPNNGKIILGTIGIDFIISITIIFILNFNYNGILLWVFVSLVAYTKRVKKRYMLMVLAIVSFLVTDYELFAINYRLYSVIDYISYYDSTTQQYLLGIYNVLVSINVIVFIIYCIYVIQEQRGTIDEVNILYEKLSEANGELQKANIELQKYAIMKEKMGETKERNRLAREIHDTLGHTLTGISAGIDACIATVEKSPKSTKKQLEVISDVTRQGILDVRQSVNKLRPDALSRLDLECAIKKMVTNINEGTTTKVFFDCAVTNLKFSEDEENAIYRVIQESITNAIRHGKAKKIWVSIQKDNGELVFVIKDNGIGCTNIKSGFGIKHIIERIGILNGTVVFYSLDGFAVNARIPIRWGKEYD